MSNTGTITQGLVMTSGKIEGVKELKRKSDTLSYSNDNWKSLPFLLCRQSNSMRRRSGLHKDGDGLFQLKSAFISTMLCSKYKDFLYASRLRNLSGRLLESFQDDAKVWRMLVKDPRSQGGKERSRKSGKDLKISDIKTKSKDNDKGSMIKDYKCMKEQAAYVGQR
ncbi:hypothetical protein Tco_0321073 [Tanacetum coccineum]